MSGSPAWCRWKVLYCWAVLYAGALCAGSCFRKCFRAPFDLHCVFLPKFSCAGSWVYWRLSLFWEKRKKEGDDTSEALTPYFGRTEYCSQNCASLSLAAAYTLSILLSELLWHQGSLSFEMGEVTANSSMKEHATFRVRNVIYLYFLPGDLQELVCCSDFFLQWFLSEKMADLIRWTLLWYKSERKRVLSFFLKQEF